MKPISFFTFIINIKNNFRFRNWNGKSILFSRILIMVLVKTSFRNLFYKFWALRKLATFHLGMVFECPFSSLLLLVSKDVERLEQKSPMMISTLYLKQPKMDLRPRESLNLPQRFLKWCRFMVKNLEYLPSSQTLVNKEEHVWIMNIRI